MVGRSIARPSFASVTGSGVDFESSSASWLSCWGARCCDQHEGHPGVRRELAEELPERLEAARGGADADDGKGAVPVAFDQRSLGVLLGDQLLVLLSS